MFNQIVFDMDGTLFSSEEMILPAYERGVAAFNKLYPDNQLSLPRLEGIIRLLGYPIDDIYNTLFPTLCSDGQQQIRTLILNEMIKSIKNMEGLLFPAVYEILTDLFCRGYKLFIASNGQFDYLKAILETYDLLPFFQPIITLNYTSICDKGDILLKYQKLYQIDVISTVMVGDRESDVKAAKKLGCSFIGCDYGHGKRDEIDSAEMMIYSFSEILKWIK